MQEVWQAGISLHPACTGPSSPTTAVPAPVVSDFSHPSSRNHKLTADSNTAKSKEETCKPCVCTVMGIIPLQEGEWLALRVALTCPVLCLKQSNQVTHLPVAAAPWNLMWKYWAFYYTPGVKDRKWSQKALTTGLEKAASRTKQKFKIMLYVHQIFPSISRETLCFLAQEITQA